MAGRATASVAVYIPADFERDLKAGRRPQVVAFYNQQFLTAAGVASSGLSDSLAAGVDSAASPASGAPQASRIGSLVVETIVLVNPARNYAHSRNSCVGELSAVFDLPQLPQSLLAHRNRPSTRFGTDNRLIDVLDGVFYNHLLQFRGRKTIQKECEVMKAADVMVSNVITVNVNATIGEVAATLLNNHISAAPVVDEKGGLVGIVSEGDLLRRPEIGTTRRHSWWLELISTGWASANEYIKSHSGKVADVMTRKVVTAKPDTPLGEIAGLLERNRIKRVPIVEGGKLVGIVSRANILQALASATKKLPSLASVDDLELRKKVVSRMASEPWRPTMLTVTVRDGTVDLWGLVHSVEEKKAAQLAAETTPGVRAVVNNIIVQRAGYGWS